VEWQTLTQSREFLGTPLYAAPEQLFGEPATPRSDLYAWGLVLLECLTGRHPFAEEGAAARLLSGGGAVELPEWLRGHRLGELLEAVTAREAEKRDGSVEALLEALDEIARGELPEAPEACPTPPPLTGQGERRQLTVMFCDLVGSSALSQRLDAESYRELVRAYQARAAEAVERYAGHVAQYLGDGLLVYFGHPQAHEDDAERALRAGREVLRGLALLSARSEAEHGVALAARIGVHTGPVVVGEMGSGATKEVLALGDTPNIAARLEAFAEPPALKGISEPLRVHRVEQPSGVTSRLERAPKLTPFVGRAPELAQLAARFEQAREGQGQAVLIGGEAGIGKSRLVRELRQRLRDTPHSWLECHTSPYTQQSAFYPVIELLESALDFKEEDSGEEKLARLERGLAHAGMDLPETVPLFAGLLSLRLPEGYAPLEMSPQLQRQKTLAALLAWLLALAEKQPLGEAAPRARRRGPALDRPVDARVAGARDRTVPHRKPAGADDPPPGFRGDVARARARPAARSDAAATSGGEAPGRRGRGTQQHARRADRSAGEAIGRHPALRGGAGEGSHGQSIGADDSRDAPGLPDGAAGRAR
jgi:class 3 adenylate cyclase